MRIALYNKNPKESKTLSDQLKQCAMEYLRFAKVISYVKKVPP